MGSIGGRGLMADRKTPLRFLATLAVVGCAVLGMLTVAGRGPLTTPSRPDTWVSPTAYRVQPDNPMPPRTTAPMVPDQFDAVNSPGKLAGTGIPTLVVRDSRVAEMVGSAVVWSAGYRSLPAWDGRITLPVLAALVSDSPHPDWLRRTEPGVYLLSVGLVQAPGTALEIAAPRVRELRLAFRPHVYVSGVGATARFDGVKVTSWVPEAGGPAPDPAADRPFVSYGQSSRLDVINSQFSYLGTDATRAYGVSWGRATTGSAVGSVFQHNLFGAYTGHAAGVEFRDNVFRNNARYGLDPHSGSSKLVVVGNEAYGNNSHGIIFSDLVHHSVIEGNRSHDNGGNGIMVDERSDHNIIRNNMSWNNRGDGIVVQGSSHTQVIGNEVSGNPVGIRINANKLGPTVDTRVVGNELTGNRRGVEVYGGARDTVTQDNVITDTATQALNFVEPATSVSDTIIDARKAVVVARSATIRGLTTSDVGWGVIAEPGARVRVESSRIAARDTGVKAEPGSQVELLGTGPGTTISAASEGVVVSGGTAELRNVSIDDAQRGVLVGPDGRATITDSTISAADTGVEVKGPDAEARVRLVSTEVRAPEPVVATSFWRAATGNELSITPSWLAVAGALFVLAAVLLHLGHRVVGSVADRCGRGPRARPVRGELVTLDRAEHRHPVR